MARQKRPQGNAHQLSLFESENGPPLVLPSEPIQAQCQEDTTLEPDDDDQSWKDKKERLRSWLQVWANEHQFPRLTFTLFDGKKGYTGIVEPGVENWTQFLATADLDSLMRARMSAAVGEVSEWERTDKTVSENTEQHQEPAPSLPTFNTRDLYRRARRLALAEMISIRTWLAEWGKLHGHPAFSFPIGSGASGDYRAGAMLAGEQGWSQALRCEDMEWVIKAVEWIQAGNVPCTSA